MYEKLALCNFYRWVFYGKFSPKVSIKLKNAAEHRQQVRCTCGIEKRTGFASKRIPRFCLLDSGLKNEGVGVAASASSTHLFFQKVVFRGEMGLFQKKKVCLSLTAT